MPTPQGQITLFVDGVQLQQSNTDANGAWQTSIVIAPGDHTAYAVFAGNSSFAGSASMVIMFTVPAPVPAETTTTLSVTVDPDNPANPVSFNVQVA